MSLTQFSSRILNYSNLRWRKFCFVASLSPWLWSNWRFYFLLWFVLCALLSLASCVGSKILHYNDAFGPQSLSCFFILFTSGEHSVVFFCFWLGSSAYALMTKLNFVSGIEINTWEKKSEVVCYVLIKVASVIISWWFNLRLTLEVVKEINKNPSKFISSWVQSNKYTLPILEFVILSTFWFAAANQRNISELWQTRTWIRHLQCCGNFKFL